MHVPPKAFSRAGLRLLRRCKFPTFIKYQYRPSKFFMYRQRLLLSCNPHHLPQKSAQTFISKSFLTATRSIAHRALQLRPQQRPPFPVPQITVSSFKTASDPTHASSISQILSSTGILKIALEFADPSSTYLTSLLHTLHKNHAHAFPISHSATRGWFWDVRPTTTNLQTANHQARSETAEDFPWHTDCSYEEMVPRYFALQVLQHDRFGGGTLSVLNVRKLAMMLGKQTREALMLPEYRFKIPREFVKDEGKMDIVGRILRSERGGLAMRYREDIITPLTRRAEEAAGQLERVLKSTSQIREATIRLTAMDLPARSIILIDNRRWLHARNHIHDAERHLRRVRWDAVPFDGEVSGQYLQSNGSLRN